MNCTLVFSIFQLIFSFLHSQPVGKRTGIRTGNVTTGGTICQEPEIPPRLTVFDRIQNAVSVHDDEITAFSERFFPSDLDMIHTGGRRALTAVSDHPPYRFFLTLDDSFNPSVREVSDPTRNLLPLRLVPGCIPEIHPLDTATYPYMRPDRHGSL